MKTTTSSYKSAASILILLTLIATSSADISAIDESLNPTIISREFQNSTISKSNSTSYNSTAQINDPLYNSTSGSFNSTKNATHGNYNTTRYYESTINSTQQQYPSNWNGSQGRQYNNGSLLSNGTSNMTSNQTGNHSHVWNNKTNSSGSYHGSNSDYDYTSNSYDYDYTTSDQYAILTLVGVIFKLVIFGATIFVLVKYCKNRRERLRNTQFMMNQINNPQQVQYVPQQNYSYQQYPGQQQPQQQQMPVGYSQNTNPAAVVIVPIVAQNIPLQQPQSSQYQQL